MDELLGRVDESRRGFIRKLIGGAFAAPILASFSMDGLTMVTAEAGPVISNQLFCANMTTSNMTDCCALAEFIADRISCLLEATRAAISDASLRGPNARKASAVKSLEKALEFMIAGIEEGDGDCTTAHARSKFTYAHGWMINYTEVLADLIGPAKPGLSLAATNIIGLIDDLLACSEH